MRLISLIFLSLSLHAKLPELSTKQSLDNIRFISVDGTITYYQLRSGALSFSSNYKSKVLFKNPLGTGYQITSSPSQKQLTIEIDLKSHDEYNLLKNNEIHTSEIGGLDTMPVGNGISPKLHLGDNFISYFRPIEREIIIKSIHDKDAPKITIPLLNSINPYFIPEVVMLTPQVILFTDINKSGKAGVMKYSVGTKKYTNIVKGQFNGTKFELCSYKNNLYMGEFSYPTLKRGSKITHYDIKGKTSLGKGEVLYESSTEDPGNLACFTTNNKLYFVKQIKLGENEFKTEAAEIDLKTKNLTIVSDLKYVTQIISMDGRILIPFRESFYVISGESNLNDDKFKKAKEDEKDKK